MGDPGGSPSRMTPGWSAWPARGTTRRGAGSGPVAPAGAVCRGTGGSYPPEAGAVMGQEPGAAQSLTTAVGQWGSETAEPETQRPGLRAGSWSWTLA